MKLQIKTGSEWHSTERRGAMVYANGNPIYKVFTPTEQPEWEPVGNKASHGKWCTASYDLPTGTKVDFIATANGKPDIKKSFVVGDGDSVEVDGYTYNGNICGWIVSLEQ